MHRIAMYRGLKDPTSFHQAIQHQVNTMKSRYFKIL